MTDARSLPVNVPPSPSSKPAIPSTPVTLRRSPRFSSGPPPLYTPVKRGRGRPRKVIESTPISSDVAETKTVIEPPSEPTSVTTSDDSANDQTVVNILNDDGEQWIEVVRRRRRRKDETSDIEKFIDEDLTKRTVPRNLTYSSMTKGKPMTPSRHWTKAQLRNFRELGDVHDMSETAEFVEIAPNAAPPVPVVAVPPIEQQVPPPLPLPPEHHPPGPALPIIPPAPPPPPPSPPKPATNDRRLNINQPPNVRRESGGIGWFIPGAPPPSRRATAAAQRNYEYEPDLPDYVEIDDNDFDDNQPEAGPPPPPPKRRIGRPSSTTPTPEELQRVFDAPSFNPFKRRPRVERSPPATPRTRARGPPVDDDVLHRYPRK